MENRLKTLTVTTHRAINYGAVLQAYALQNALINEGFDNLLLESENENGNFFKPISFSSFRSFLISLYVNYQMILNLKSVKRLKNGFNNFVMNNLKTTKLYRSYEDLLQNPPEASIYISGSDQVFAVDCAINDLLFQERFLNFGPSTVKRISYAASVGDYNLNEEQKKQLLDNLKRFDLISLRERKAIDYYQQFLPYSFRSDIDPTFLIPKEKWRALIKDRPFNEPYILCYPLLGNSNLRNIVEQLRKKTGLKVICIASYPIKRIKADKYVFDASPEEFLTYFYYSDYIITTSFHGTAFSIIFNKQFYSLVKDYKAERIVNILSLLGLNNRLIHEHDSINKITYDVINYENVELLLKEEREKSLNYLRGLKQYGE